MIFAMRHYDLWIQYNPDKASVFFGKVNWLHIWTSASFHYNLGLDLPEHEFHFLFEFLNVVW